MNAVLSANVFFRIAGFSVFQALLSTFTALLIGLPAAFFCGRRIANKRKGFSYHVF